MENSVNRLFDIFEGVKESASWRAVFGEPQTQGDTTIIPVASITYGMGMGIGTSGAECEGDAPDGEPAGGAGGGAGALSKPVAIIIVTPEKTSVRPVIDRSMVLIASMCTAAWVVFCWTGVIKKYIKMREAAQS